MAEQGGMADPERDVRSITQTIKGTLFNRWSITVVL